MKTHVRFLVMLMFSIATINSVEAATTATASVTYIIGAFSAISVSGNPGTLTINTAVAGSSPASATDSTTNYSLWTNNTAQKITGILTSTMPTGLTLSVNFTAPSGATSNGTVALSTTTATLVTGIANVAPSGLGIVYTLAATPNAVAVTGATNTVTYTISS